MVTVTRTRSLRERLFDEVEGAQPRGVHRVGDGAVSGDHRHGQRLVHLADFGERFEPVHARHLDVEQHEIWPIALDERQAVRTGGGTDEPVALVLQNHPQRIADGGFVVNDQDAGLQRWSSLTVSSVR